MVCRACETRSTQKEWSHVQEVSRVGVQRSMWQGCCGFTLLSGCQALLRMSHKAKAARRGLSSTAAEGAPRLVQPRGQRGKCARPNRLQREKLRNGSRGARDKGEKRKQHTAHCLPPFNSKHHNHNYSSSNWQRPQQCALSDTVSCR